MKCFERASPALREILLKLHRAEKTLAVDHHWHEFGSVEYHIQSSALDSNIADLSISTPLLCKRLSLKNELHHSSKEMAKAIVSNVVEIIEPTREGYQLTLRLDLAKLPQGKRAIKMITEISSVQATILSSQLKDILNNVKNEDASKGISRPIKLMYHPREPFFVVNQSSKMIAIFPMRFKEESDVMIATSFIQELIDLGSSKSYARAPLCSWSPIPPPELRGEHLNVLSTNGGFVTFDISSYHIKGKRLDKTVWCLLNFYAFVKYHVKCTRGFIQRRMRNRLESLVKVLDTNNLEQDQGEEHIPGCGCMGEIIRIPKSPKMRRGCGFTFTNKVKRINFKIKIHWFSRFRKRWLSIPKFSSTMKYQKLE